MKGKLSTALGVSVVVVIALLSKKPFNAVAAHAESPWSAPEFTHSKSREWLNSEPLKLTDLRGKVILIDFWSYGCWNCYRSFPWLTALEEKYKAHEFLVVGVHSPEFDHEKDRAKVAQKIKEFGLSHPVMIDNDFSYWKAMHNRYWPTFYLIDKAGRVRASFIGETHTDDRNARAIEMKIKELLQESAPS